MQAIIGQKVSQTQRFLEDGKRIPVTMVSLLGGNVVTQIKTSEKEGYSSIQVGIGNRKKATRAVLGHVKGAKLEKAPLFIREVTGDDAFEIGKVVKATEVLEAGDIVDVIGISKGKGYAGGVKRHNFKGGPRTHGQSDRERAPGSIGQTTTPGRVYKGKRMAGRMGHDRVTVQNLLVVGVTDDEVLIKGLVPGPVNNLIMVKKVGKIKKFTPLYAEPKEEVVVEAPVEEPVAEAVDSAASEISAPAEVAETASADVSVDEVKAEEPVVEQSEEDKKEEVVENANS